MSPGRTCPHRLEGRLSLSTQRCNAGPSRVKALQKAGKATMQDTHKSHFAQKALAHASHHMSEARHQCH